MNNSICIFLHLQCNTGPSHMCNLQNSFTKLIQSKYRVQAGSGERRSGGKVWKDPAFQSKKKEKSHHPTSDVMSECSSNMDLAEQLLVSLFPTNTLLPSSVILLMPLLCITVQSHDHISAIIVVSHCCMTIPHQSLSGQPPMDV